MKSRLRSHRHEHGRICHCPFGNQEPYVSPRHREIYGSMWHEAAKLDWLLSRPDVKDDPTKEFFVRSLARAFPNADQLYPWLLREWKKGRVNAGVHTSSGARDFEDFEDLDPSVLNWDEPGDVFQPWFRFKTHDGYTNTLDDDHLEQIQDWMKYQKQAGKGVDIMGHEIGPAVHHAQKSDIGGEVVHEFDNGWKVVRLRNKRDMRREGQRMDHCVGSNGQGYIEKNEDGEALYYSLRDPHNEPHGTAELGKVKEEYYRCPQGHFSTGKLVYDENHQAHHVCPECEAPLFSGYYVHDPEDLHEGVKRFPVDLHKIGAKPSADVTSIEQMFGPHDHKMDEWHNDLFNQFFGQHGHGWYESDGDSEEEEEFEPWWDSEYYIDGPTNISDYISHVNGHYLDDNAPDEWHRAVSDAYEHEMDPPELYASDPDWDDIFEEMKDANPEDINELWETAASNGEAEELLDRAQEWLESDYYPFLDPYGELDYQNFNKPGLPGVQYPDTYPDEKYFARNLEYQLDKHFPRNPQTGAREGISVRRNRNPLMRPSEGTEPRFGPTQLPVSEESGSAWMPLEPDPNSDDYSRRRQVMWAELPYGRGQDVHPGERAQEPSLQYNIPRLPQDKGFTPSPPHGLEPEEYFGPGQEDIRHHQRSLPITWQDEHGKTQRPYNPSEPYMYPQGEQQGKLWPGGWFIDKEKKRAKETELPPELFHPEQYGYHHPEFDKQAYHQIPEGSFNNVGFGPEQLPMWENQGFESGKGFTAPINTQNEPHTLENPPNPLQPVTRPMMPVAKTAGPWTDTEQAGGQLRPQKNPDQGYGIYDVDVDQGIPHLNGRIVEQANPQAVNMEGFEWRRPVVYDPDEDRLYVGNPGGEHTDMMLAFHKPSPWATDNPMEPGLIDTTGYLDEPGLQFFYGQDNIPNVDQFHDWVEQQHGVRNPNTGPPEYTKAEVWSKAASDERLPDDPIIDWYSDPVAYDAYPDPEREMGRVEFNRYRDQQLDEREKQDWITNPDPQKWTPGVRGKAFLDTDGVLHTWNDRSGSQFWQHSQQARMRGVDNDYDTHIYIRPDGSVRDEYDIAFRYPEKAQAMLEQNPNLSWEGMPEKEDESEEFWSNQDWGHESTYHPRQEDEWFADDLPVFSAVIPEPRWKT